MNRKSFIFDIFMKKTVDFQKESIEFITLNIII